MTEAEKLANLKAAYRRVANFPDFKPEERAWWLELRKAVEIYIETK